MNPGTATPARNGTAAALSAEHKQHVRETFSFASYLRQQFPNAQFVPDGGGYMKVSGEGLGHLSFNDREHCFTWDGAGIQGDCFRLVGYLERLHSFPDQLRRCAELANVMPPVDLAPVTVPPSAGRMTREPDHTYRYHDRTGALVYEVVRWDEPGGGKRIAQRRPDGAGGWIWNMQGVDRQLYNLEDVIEAAALGKRVFVAEGEKAADALTTRGCTATTVTGGAGKPWEARYSEDIEGAHIVVLPDNDNPGRRHAQTVAAAVAPVAASVRVVPLFPHGDDGRDIFDWLEAGGTIEELEALIQQTPLWSPDAPGSAPADQDAPPLEYSDVPPRDDPRLLAPEDPATLATIFIPTADNRPPTLPPVLTLDAGKILTAGNMSVVTALPGTGKSAVCEAIAAAAICGHADTFGFTAEEGARVLYIDGERSRGDHWNSADRTRRRALIADGYWLPDHVMFALFSLEPSIAKRRDMLERMVDDFAPTLLILDGLADFCANVLDPEGTVEWVNWLTATAKSRDLGVITTIHPNPSGEFSKARGHLGSEAMRRAESVFLLERNADGTRTLKSRFTLGKVRNDRDDLSSAFRWDNDRLMFVSCAAPDPAALRHAGRLEDIAVRYAADPIGYRDLVRAIAQGEGKSEATAKRRVDDMRKAEIITATASGLYQLAGGGSNDPF